MRALAVKSFLVAFGLMLVAPAFAKDDTPIMPQYILRARTVAVIIDPGAGVSVRDPNANQTARKDVETALLNWGRFQPIMSVDEADLVIVIRKGTKAPADVTVADPRQNRRGGMIDPTGDGISIGAQHGQPPPASSGSRPPVPVSSGPESTAPTTQAGTPGDVFEVYEGKVENPLDGSPGWRYVKKDALHSHDVPAVAAFRKAIDEAEKQAAKQKGNHP
jgi:hypothetical protein